MDASVMAKILLLKKVLYMRKYYIYFISSGSSIRVLQYEIKQKSLIRFFGPFYLNYILPITLASIGKCPFSVHISFNNNATALNFF